MTDTVREPSTVEIDVTVTSWVGDPLVLTDVIHRALRGYGACRSTMVRRTTRADEAAREAREDRARTARDAEGELERVRGEVASRDVEIATLQRHIAMLRENCDRFRRERDQAKGCLEEIVDAVDAVRGEMHSEDHRPDPEPEPVDMAGLVPADGSVLPLPADVSRFVRRW